MNAERIKLGLEELGRALDRFEEVLNEDIEDNEFALDASIQRFEFCYELTWKLLKHVAYSEGYETGSPKQAFKKAYQLKLIDNEDLWNTMKEDRNLTVHTYKEELALEIYDRIRSYYKEMRLLEEKLKKRD